VEKPYVLLADDNEGTCTLITALLQHEFQVDIAGDGFEAIEKLKARPYAALLLDLLMPAADGYAVLDFVKEERPEFLSRVLVVTASISQRHTERLESYAIAGVIAKPFEIDALIAAVRQIAGADGGAPLRMPLLSSGMLLLLADLLRQRLI
jgi:two-component system sensor histidine kinase/response regulator